MLKKRNTQPLMVAMLLCYCLGARADTALSIGSFYETDTETFALCCSIAGYEPRAGYRVEGFSRLDINGDEVTDVVASLVSGGGSDRLLVIMMSGSQGYSVIENSVALPSAADGWLCGVEVNADRIVLYMEVEGEKKTQSQYVFSREEDQFHLSTMTKTIWAVESGEAQQEIVDFLRGEYTASRGRVEKSVYRAESMDGQTQFDAYGVGAQLDSFDVSSLPPDWSTYQPFVGGAGPAAQASAQMVRCPACGEWVSGSQGLGAHICPALAAAPDQGKIFCHACGQWYAEGEEFRNHSCIHETNGQQVQCTRCGGWFEESALASHACVAAEVKRVQCPVCSGWFAEGSEYLGHICVSYPASSQMYCDVCGGWFEEGDAFRSHACAPRQASEPGSVP